MASEEQEIKTLREELTATKAALKEAVDAENYATAAEQASHAAELTASLTRKKNIFCSKCWDKVYENGLDNPYNDPEWQQNYECRDWSSFHNYLDPDQRGGRMRKSSTKRRRKTNRKKSSRRRKSLKIRKRVKSRRKSR